MFENLKPFVLCKDFDTSVLFYKTLGFKVEFKSNDICEMSLDQCSFLLQNYYIKEFSDNLMLQLIVSDVGSVYSKFSSICYDYGMRIDSPKKEPWGMVSYMWGPSGELWHITELD